MQETDIQRYNMVHNQLKPAGIVSATVLEAMATEARENYLPNQLKTVAYADSNLPYFMQTTLCSLPPQQIGLLLQALKIDKTDKILESHTGSGYLTALLARLGKAVISLEPNTKNYQTIKKKFSNQQLYPNVRVFNHNIEQGFSIEAPFDVICLTNAIDKKPDFLFSDLKQNGRLLTLTRKNKLLEAVLYKKDNSSTVQSITLFETLCPDFKHIKPTEFDLSS